MEITASENILLAFFTANPWLGTSLDWLIKSALIIGLTVVLIRTFGNRLSSVSKHLLWLNSLVCAALVPLFMALSSLLESSPAITTQLVAIQVIPSNAYVISTGTEFPSWASGLITVLYLLPILVLFIRLATSIANVLRINRNAEAVLDSATLNRLTQLRAEQHISRPVKVSYCSTIASPLSFGLFRPHIILPLRASSWDGKVLDDVLIHELNHIKRFDWLSMLIAYVIASILWINPLAWVAVRRVNEEAENSCDGAVLRLKDAENSYAETLLSIAHDIKNNSSPKLFAQMMLDETTLSMRIHRILENHMASATSHRFFAIPLATLALSILVTCTSTQLMTTESTSRPPPEANRNSRGVILPIVALAPQYPTRAAFAGIEGWALTEFDVLVNGDVDAESVRVIDAEPAYMFDRAVIRAARKFKFEPVAGTEPQEIAGVQYLFRFSLTDEDGNGDGINREFQPTNSVTPPFPAAARAADVRGASVYTVFHVTRAGSVQDVIVLYSSNDQFNEVAIAAAQQLQFRARGENDPVQGNVDGDTTGLVRAQYLFSFE